jgi:hypothetical protein
MLIAMATYVMLSHKRVIRAHPAAKISSHAKPAPPLSNEELPIEGRFE